MDGHRRRRFDCEPKSSYVFVPVHEAKHDIHTAQFAGERIIIIESLEFSVQRVGENISTCIIESCGVVVIVVHIGLGIIPHIIVCTVDEVDRHPE